MCKMLNKPVNAVSGYLVASQIFRRRTHRTNHTFKPGNKIEIWIIDKGAATQCEGVNTAAL